MCRSVSDSVRYRQAGTGHDIERCLHGDQRRSVWATGGKGTFQEPMQLMRARRAFFQLGSIGAFDGEFNPASIRSIIETCVMPVLPYG
jgi:hypothetical protein